MCRACRRLSKASSVASQEAPILATFCFTRSAWALAAATFDCWTAIALSFAAASVCNAANRDFCDASVACRRAMASRRASPMAAWASRQAAEASPTSIKASGAAPVELPSSFSNSAKPSDASAASMASSIDDRLCTSCSMVFCSCVRASTSSETAARSELALAKSRFEAWSCDKALCIGATACSCFWKYMHHCSACACRPPASIPGCSRGSLARSCLEISVSFGGAGFDAASWLRALLFSTSAYCCNKPCAADARVASLRVTERSKKTAPGCGAEPCMASARSASNCEWWAVDSFSSLNKAPKSGTALSWKKEAAPSSLSSESSSEELEDEAACATAAALALASA
mmetsp:Transcript_29423/g.68227  ORF Transcript_29423/g.68227 Transcript_29423/m.68227 type:complete len:345 (+) Transcript_29423:146-1180(+)